MQFLVKAGSSICANHTPESYPQSYPRIIPQKITIMNVSFGIVWDCIGLTSYNGPGKLIDQCWPDPMIPGYLHIPSRSGESSPRAQSLIIIPKLAGSGWLSGWLAGWLARWLAQLLLLIGWLAIGLASCSWLAGWLAVLLMRLMWGMILAAAGWLATKPNSVEEEHKPKRSWAKGTWEEHPEETPAGRRI